MSRRRSGMTLVEVMLAITILGFGITALITTTSRCLGVVRKAKNLEIARRLLEQVDVEKPLQLEEEVVEGTDSGTFTDGPPGFRWTRTIVPLDEEDEETPLFVVTTTVSWTDSGRSSSEETVTYFYAAQNVKGGTVETP